MPNIGRNEYLILLYLAFQIAVALAQTEDEKDTHGRILIKPEHIQSTVSLAMDFKSYLFHLHKKDESARAALHKNRYDAFGREETPGMPYR